MKLRKCAVIIPGLMIFSLHAQDQIIQDGINNALDIDKTETSMVVIGQSGQLNNIIIDQTVGTSHMATVFQGLNNIDGTVTIIQAANNNSADVNTDSILDEVTINQSVALGGDGNSALVWSMGDGTHVLEMNVFEVDQTSLDSHVHVHNHGSLNQYNVQQGGINNGVSVEVFSDFGHLSQSNQLFIVQNGDNNYMEFDFKGSTNLFNLNQDGSGNFMGLNSEVIAPEVTQGTVSTLLSNNDITFNQFSTNSHIHLEHNALPEDAVGNTVVIDQTTTDSWISGRFHGSDNNINLAQSGADHHLYFDAGGINNTLDIDMLGDTHSLHLVQGGDTNTLTVLFTVDSSGADMQVEQFGTNNVSDIFIGPSAVPE